WLVEFPIAMVSAMYRLVMRWVTDGSGGTGLSEEEFGPWAVKINAGITFIEYTLTFLVSMSALVTFMADRAPVLNHPFLGVHGFGRLAIAVVLSIATGWIVNRGPKAAARAFGPATAGVLVLLWLMVIATIVRHITGAFDFSILPRFDLQAFSLSPTPPIDPATLEGASREVLAHAKETTGDSFLSFTIGGYVRILAVMTGIEVFANLVAAYSGSAADKAHKAFGSLLIIMGTAGVTMLVVGPAIFHVADPYIGDEVSVFTQTMDYLLPTPVAYAGTVVAIAVLLSASAASAQGLQNLALGLATRHYVPDWFGRPNEFGVADKPVWLEVAVCCLLFAIAGTEESTYLAIYAAGVFILLSMTGWAASKRLIRFLRVSHDWGHAFTLSGASIAAALTTVATVVIFYERFREGAWTYFVLVPALFVAFTYFRSRLGDPSPLQERLGELEEAAWGGFGPGQRALGVPEEQVLVVDAPPVAVATPDALGVALTTDPIELRHMLVSLDGSDVSEQSLPLAISMMKATDGKLTLISVVGDDIAMPGPGPEVAAERTAYLIGWCERISALGIDCSVEVRSGAVYECLLDAEADLVCDSLSLVSRGRSGLSSFVLGSTAREVIQRAHLPLIVTSPQENVPPAGDVLLQAAMRRVLVALDGSYFAERMLPYARALGHEMGTEIIALTVPPVPEPNTYGPLADIVGEMRRQSEEKAVHYLEQVVGSLKAEGLDARGLVTGSGPARTILRCAESENVSMVMMATHGLGGIEGLVVGSVALRVIRNATGPVFLLPIRERTGVAGLLAAE
ncbi:MAG: universal stress protein, partial [Anaerolineae bacterium]